MFSDLFSPLFLDKNLSHGFSLAVSGKEREACILMAPVSIKTAWVSIMGRVDRFATGWVKCLCGVIGRESMGPIKPPVHQLESKERWLCLEYLVALSTLLSRNTLGTWNSCLSAESTVWISSIVLEIWVSNAIARLPHHIADCLRVGVEQSPGNLDGLW